MGQLELDKSFPVYTNIGPPRKKKKIACMHHEFTYYLTYHTLNIERALVMGSLFITADYAVMDKRLGNLI